MNDQQLSSDLDLFTKFDEMFQRRLAEIPTKQISGVGRPEDVADAYYTNMGFHVFRSRARDGYRCLVDASANWHKLKQKDRETVTAIKSSIPLDVYILLVKAIRSKVGTPDLLLLKDGTLSFVEVKALRESVQPCTVRFFLSYAHIWSISILRVDAKRMPAEFS